jgi:hypothetical protein
MRCGPRIRYHIVARGVLDIGCVGAGAICSPTRSRGRTAERWMDAHLVQVERWGVVLLASAGHLRPPALLPVLALQTLLHVRYSIGNNSARVGIVDTHRHAEAISEEWRIFLGLLPVHERG